MKWNVSFNDGPYHEDHKAGECFRYVLIDALEDWCKYAVRITDSSERIDAKS